MTTIMPFFRFRVKPNPKPNQIPNTNPTPKFNRNPSHNPNPNPNPNPTSSPNAKPSPNHNPDLYLTLRVEMGLLTLFFSTRRYI